ncbi:alanine--glyoxylate aminotransferase family protein [Aerococcus sp. 1KP-2016]|uniref:pyridoxal-phosphate-dependent aminotransferase family protein n=1 Tax=Aerococcus sp. 1KP-2016 TaxID=1981982 RepID=UPI000B98A121|nr:aminotransferase class V-fold PLP-dependent enzyme [Aerococcus sp. 1KP-2016]OYQ66750.1 hypothetical protein B9P78_05275 [Aerococcus sp. 1KP-2016]
MHSNKQILLSPTNLPKPVLKSVDNWAILQDPNNIKNIYQTVQNGMKKIFATAHEVLVLPGSGTETMAASCQHFFAPGDEVVVPYNGKFGKLFYELAVRVGLNAIPVEFANGEDIDVNITLSHITANTRGILVTHNESATGITTDIAEFGRQVQKYEDILLIVDAVSSAGCMPIDMDQKHLDVVLTTSKKALMAPPGLSFIAVNNRAWQRAESIAADKSTSPFGGNLVDADLIFTKNAPATEILVAVYQALQLLEARGLENVYTYHAENAKLLRTSMKDLGFQLLAKNPSSASNSVTCILAPGKAKYYIKELKKRNIEVGVGLDALTEDTFRVSTMGYISKQDITSFIRALNEIVTTDELN